MNLDTADESCRAYDPEVTSVALYGFQGGFVVLLNIHLFIQRFTAVAL